MSSTNAEWYYARDGVQSGPLDLSALRGMFAAGQLSAQDLVWREGMAAWMPTSAVPELVSTPPASAISDFRAPAVAPNFDPQTGNVLQPTYAPPPPGGGQQPFAGQQGYGASMSPNFSSPNPAGPSQQGMAIAGFVMSLIPAFPLPLLGLIFSVIALKAMKRTGNFEGKGFATAGAIIGGVLTGLVCVVLLIWVVLFAVFAGAAASGAGH